MSSLVYAPSSLVLVFTRFESTTTADPSVIYLAPADASLLPQFVSLAHQNVRAVRLSFLLFLF